MRYQKKVLKVLASLLHNNVAGEKGEIKVSCLTANDKRCEEGHCKAKLYLEKSVYACVTGIIPNADFLGQNNFVLGDVLSIKGGKVMIQTRTHGLMQLEQRKVA